MNTKFGKKISPRTIQVLITLALSSIFGFALYCLFYGPATLNVSYVDWIYKTGGDLFQTQLGWEWFRQTPWHFPLGRIDLYGYPFGTYVTYMNAIPLAAIVSKLFSPILPQHFQYIGLWNLTSLIGQFFFGMLIVREFTRSYPKQITAAALLTISAPLIYRAFYHDSLTSQWLILAGIWLTLFEYRHQRSLQGLWILLLSTALVIHIYLMVMIAPMYAISLYFRYFREKKIGRVLIDLAICIAFLLILGYATGLFSLRAGDLYLKGLGYYSWNLDGFIDPQQTSAIFHGLPQGTEGQYEGLSYLGLGNLVLLPLAIFLYFKKESPRRHKFFVLPFVLISVLFTLFALSNQAYLGSHLLWGFQLPDVVFKVLSFFRASARFIWPVYYFIIVFSLVSWVRNSRFSFWILLVAVGLQLLDLQPLISAKQVSGGQTYEIQLQSEFWNNAARSNDHLVLYPAEDAWPVYEPLALYTLQNNMTINWGYFSRANYPEIANLGRHSWEDLQAGHAASDTIYIIWGNEAIAQAKQQLSDTLLVCQIDDYEVVLSPSNPVLQSEFDLSPYCTFPKALK